ncbi:MAG: aconitate hydratase AcnA [Phycisphaeraceae bacterium]|nr:aconitate hydratase AcnA [Phycisphaeraceae bacterium]
MAPNTSDPFHARATIDTPLGPRTIYRLDALAKTFANVSRLPYSMRVLLEAVLRNYDGRVYPREAVEALARYDAKNVGEVEIPFMPGRVVLQDFTGVPAVVDLAAMRAAMVRMTGKPESARKVNPLVPCDLVIDHSVQVDAFGSGAALKINSDLEFERNKERYEFLKWGQKALSNFRVVPPATGIVHQVNLENLAKVAWDNGKELYPDSLVGTDSHTTMINGLGVVGWGVGGIEAEAVMLGQPIYMLIPQVVGFKLTGQAAEGVTATDVVLVVTQMLRAAGVVNKFVEFFGPGLDDMPLANRATIANMAPEYGATIGFFPVDEQTIRYLRLSGRDEKLIATVEQYYKLQGLWRQRGESGQDITYSSTLELNLATVEPSLAGPKRPQDRIALTGMKKQWQKDLPTTFSKPAAQSATLELDGKTIDLRDGAVVIAAITSCTNTSNPEVMIGAGLVAKKAHEKGLTRKPWVKTSLAPGSKVVTDYLAKAGLTEHLDALGFNLVGYGCTTCIGNSGPLPEAISRTISQHNLVAAAVLSGNRNFEGRINPDVRANYLASPPLVVAYALAGTVDIDLTTDPLGTDKQGKPVFLRDIWPSTREVQEAVERCVTRAQFIQQYADVFAGSAEWKAVPTTTGDLYRWNEKSTYIQEPPFFVDLKPTPQLISAIRGARCLVKVGDSVTTDHISPAGSIKANGPAGKYLVENGVPVSLFNSYGSRRGNDRVMTRGTFANVRVRNQLAPGTEGGLTTDFTDGQVKPIYDASVNYKSAGVPLVVLAGKDYGMGSSRDWAAKGTFLLGVKAVIAESYERIHRSNLVGMGVLPLCYQEGQTAASLGLDGSETYSIEIDDRLQPRQEVTVRARKSDGKEIAFSTVCRIDTPVEVDYYRNGGILHTVLRKMT